MILKRSPEEHTSPTVYTPANAIRKQKKLTFFLFFKNKLSFIEKNSV
jgi:hypothetical protein